MVRTVLVSHPLLTQVKAAPPISWANTSETSARGGHHAGLPRICIFLGELMTTTTQMNWQAVAADPRFQALHRKKTAVLWGLMVFSVVYYFLLPIGAAYFQDLFRIKVFGPVNVGILFALSEFIVAWGIAFYYARKANAEFDVEAAAIVRDAEKILGGRK